MNRRDLIKALGIGACALPLRAFARMGRGAVAATTQNTVALGINLNKLGYYSPENPFLNAFLNNSISAGAVSRGTTDWQTSTGGAYSGTVDSNGWPTEIQDGSANQLYMFRNLPQANAGTGANYQGGSYNVYYDGTGTVAYGLDATLSSHTAGPGGVSDWLDVINVTPSNQGILVKVTATSTAPNNIRNMRMVYQPNASTYLAGNIFDPAFLSRVQNFNPLRFMDWRQTNTNTGEANWTDRSLTTDGGYGTDYGVPWEIVCDLANTAGVDIWVNVPVNATSSYVSSLLSLLNTNLNSNRNIYIEFCNEVWNENTPQFTTAANNGKALWPNWSTLGYQTYDCALNYESYMLQAICTAAVSTFGSANVGTGKRVQILAGAQYINQGILDDVMKCSLYVANGGTALYGNYPIAGVAYAWYWNASTPNLPASWITKTTAQFISDCYTEFTTGGLVPLDGGSALSAYESNINSITSYIATNYGGLPLFGYEGGQGDTPQSSYYQYTANVATAIARSTAYSVGHYGIDDNNNIQKCTTAGTTAASAPTFSNTLGGTTTDGAVVWTRVQAASGAWAAGWTPLVGDVVKDSNGNIQAAFTVTGATGASAPTWNTVAGGTTPDGGVTWTMLDSTSWDTNFIAWSRSSDMVNCYNSTLNYWKGKGSTCRTLCQFNDIYPPDQTGMWGALASYLDTISPLASAPYKWQAIVNWASSNQKWW